MAKVLRSEWHVSANVFNVLKTAATLINRVKLLIQNQSEMRSGSLSRKYNSIGDAFSRTIKSKRCSIVLATQALNLAFRDTYKLMLAYKKERDGYAKRLHLVLLMLPLLTTAVLVMPIDSKNTKTSGARQFNGLIGVCNKALVSNGVAGLYHGFGLSEQKHPEPRVQNKAVPAHAHQFVWHLFCNTCQAVTTMSLAMHARLTVFRRDVQCKLAQSIFCRVQQLCSLRSVCLPAYPARRLAA